MHKIDSTVRRETGYIALLVCIFSLLLQAVFLVLGWWNYTVLLGNLLGGAVAVTNFLLMGMSVQKAVTQDKKQAASTMRLSQTGRMFLLFVFTLLSALLPWLHTWAAILPLLFPRIAIALRPVFKKN